MATYEITICLHSSKFIQDWNNYQGTSYDDGSAWSGYPQQQPYPQHQQQQQQSYSANTDRWQQDDRYSRHSTQSHQQYPDPNVAGHPGPNRRRLVPSEPSSHVIFLGLDLDHTEADVGLKYNIIPITVLTLCS